MSHKYLKFDERNEVELFTPQNVGPLLRLSKIFIYLLIIILLIYVLRSPPVYMPPTVWERTLILISITNY